MLLRTAVVAMLDSPDRILRPGGATQSRSPRLRGTGEPDALCPPSFPTRAPSGRCPKACHVGPHTAAARTYCGESCGEGAGHRRIPQRFQSSLADGVGFEPLSERAKAFI